MIDRIPYTYRIYCIPENKYYYGLRYGKGCHPDDLWVTYFTSSHIIEEKIQLYGAESFLYEVRKIFDCTIKAADWEKKVNSFTRKWDNYYNENASRAVSVESCAKGSPSFWLNVS